MIRAPPPTPHHQSSREPMSSSTSTDPSLPQRKLTTSTSTSTGTDPHSTTRTLSSQNPSMLSSSTPLDGLFHPTPHPVLTRPSSPDLRPMEQPLTCASPPTSTSEHEQFVVYLKSFEAFSTALRKHARQTIPSIIISLSIFVHFTQPFILTLIQYSVYSHIILFGR